MATRYANERKYKKWKETENGKRVYERKVEGKHNWYAIYYKEVDATENSLRIWQEIFNEQNELVEIHHKFSVDTGHQKIKRL